jgi:PIN domain nuclease of toxin-antitoxin system
MPRRIREEPEFWLLDTHVWVWYVEATEHRLSRAALGLLRRQGGAGRLCVSALSVWEVARLAAVGRLTLTLEPRAWVSRAFDEAGIRAVPLTTEMGLDAALLIGHPPRDPADRFLIAAARALDAVLVTRDARILEYGAAGHVKVLDAAA